MALDTRLWPRPPSRAVPALTLPASYGPGSNYPPQHLPTDVRTCQEPLAYDYPHSRGGVVCCFRTVMFRMNGMSRAQGCAGATSFKLAQCYGSRDRVPSEALRRTSLCYRKVPFILNITTCPEITYHTTLAPTPIMKQGPNGVSTQQRTITSGRGM